MVEIEQFVNIYGGKSIVKIAVRLDERLIHRGVVLHGQGSPELINCCHK